MATKRMFSKEVVGSDAFLDMPSSSQLLYFHLGMEADNDGFIGNPKKILRFIGASDDDLKILLSKRFVLLFPSGVVVIKHHRINNNWDKYNYKRTVYLEEFEQLYIKENRAYTLDKLQGSLVQSVLRLDSDWNKSLEEKRREEKRRDKNTKYNPAPLSRRTKLKKESVFNPLGAEVIKLFEEVDPKNKTYYQNKTQRAACDFLLSEYGMDQIQKRVSVLNKTNTLTYFPKITCPLELKEKWVKLNDAVETRRNQQQEKKIKIIL